MRIQVTVTLDIDPDAWMEEFGVDRAEIRADVKSYATAALRAQFDSVGVSA